MDPRVPLFDALLYPANFDGLAHTLGLAFAFAAVRFFFLQFHSLSPFASWYDHRITIMAIGLCFSLSGYAAIYFSFCVFDSTKGERRAPAILPLRAAEGGDPLSQMLLYLGAVAMCFVPAAVCYAIIRTPGLYFWMLALPGLFLLPMVLLAVTLFDGPEALNPLLAVRSIAATRLAYLGLLLKLGLLLISAVAIHWHCCRLGISRVFPYAVYLYSLWIAGHLLGRFYHRRKDALDWGL